MREVFHTTHAHIPSTANADRWDPETIVSAAATSMVIKAR
eukprot:CAMPEP_0175923726 /NCGR_PEP_ID=MMETSP0108-20121206/14724_1 /TAXON_ID=195067 ORGANISM="Goniomonas pacifica, Strain CCMP1869" /NCGR_SAMPLE_ID=MMETSP0108 /ASSEMBLY_ACC=CAM_ASM_000204 /LENGTH=39 /DNA_ID= /DNA_START= /DNA_END= /DNA_ORIENTATION=